MGRLLVRDLAGLWPARLALVWAGVSIGVAFVATPAKFLAPSLSLPVALEVGRQTFRVYNGLEIGLAVLAVALALGSAERRRWLLAFAVPVAVVAAQALWLIPALDARVLMLQAGEAPARSHLHAFYIAAEAAKVLTLLGAALIAGDARRRALVRRSSWVAASPLHHS
jgi:hypothetical protein